MVRTHAAKDTATLYNGRARRSRTRGAGFEHSHRYDHDRRAPSKAFQSARLVAVVVLSFMCVAYALAGMKDGYAAYESGDYETALKEFRTLAEHRDPPAQIAVGWLA